VFSFQKCISIKTKMKKLGVTQTHLARELGISRSLLSAVLNRKYDGQHYEIRILAKLKEIEDALCSRNQE
jgi:transcriptional regulator with XRE-family HTH domain